MYRGVLISECWNREVPLYTEVSSFQGVGIEGIQRCPHLRGIGMDSTLLHHEWGRDCTLLCHEWGRDCTLLYYE